MVAVTTTTKRDHGQSRGTTAAMVICMALMLLIGLGATMSEANDFGPVSRILSEQGGQDQDRDQKLANVLLRVHADFTEPRNHRDQQEKRQGSFGSDSSPAQDSPSMFNLAHEDSFGFFDDITNEAWKLKRQISKKQLHNGEPHILEKKRGPIPKYYYMNNWHPEFTCHFEQALGNIGDGHKWVCDPHRLAELDDCLIYSIGSYGDFSFEEAIQKIAPNCEIHIFDIVDYSHRIPSTLNAQFHPRGLQSQKQMQLRHNPRIFWSLENMMKQLGHVGRRIDVFKIDCENCEWESYEDMLEQDLRQILVEVHGLENPEMFDAFHKAGHVIFHKEPNTFVDGNVVEYSFIRLKQSFF